MVKKVVWWLLVAFAVYVLITEPNRAAGVVRDAGDGLRSVGQAIITFFDALSG